MGNCKLKKYKKTLKAYIKMEKTIIKFGGRWTEKQKFHQHKRFIPIKDMNINEIVVSNNISFGKKGFVYFSQKWVHIEEIFMKLNIYLF